LVVVVANMTVVHGVVCRNIMVMMVADCVVGIVTITSVVGVVFVVITDVVIIAGIVVVVVVVVVVRWLC